MKFTFDLDVSTPEEAWELAKLLGKRTPVLEPIILECSKCTFFYWKACLFDWKVRFGRLGRKRWIEAECVIHKDMFYWEQYIAFIDNLKVPVQEQLAWIDKEGITPELLDILNYIGPHYEVQDRIIELRPDLVSKVKLLTPFMKDKWKAELEIAKVDL